MILALNVFKESLVLQFPTERILLEVKTEAGALGYRMRPKSSRESDMLQPCKVAIIVCNVCVRLPTPGAERVKDLISLFFLHIYLNLHNPPQFPVSAYVGLISTLGRI